MKVQLGAEYKQAVLALQQTIAKSTFLFYKPIHIAEILRHGRTSALSQDALLDYIDKKAARLRDLRDEVTSSLMGRISTSNIRWQDETIFPRGFVAKQVFPRLHELNTASETSGYVEAYIYGSFQDGCQALERFLGSIKADTSTSVLEHLRLVKSNALFRKVSNKIFEIIAYALCDFMLQECRAECSISITPTALANQVSFFLERIIGIKRGQTSRRQPATIFRMGLTNANDNGVDMNTNFGVVVQVKDVLVNKDKQLDDIVRKAPEGPLVIVCRGIDRALERKTADEKDRWGNIQTIVVEKDLRHWESCCRDAGLADKLVSTIDELIRREFPAAKQGVVSAFLEKRKYTEHVVLSARELFGA